jgi:hypothetical protein
MAFGFQSVNDSSYIQIDAESPRMCVIEKGSYSSTAYKANVYFSAAITTVEPPMVFLRPQQTSSQELYLSTTLLGSAGAWTGFQVTMSNINYNPSGLWFVATFASRSTDTFGMRLFDASGAVIYDTGAFAVAFTGVLQTWTYAGRIQLTVGYRYKWVAGRAAAADEYFLLNIFSQGCQDVNAGGSCAICMDYTNNQSSMWSASISGAWTDQGNRPVIFAKLVAA